MTNDEFLSIAILFAISLIIYIPLRLIVRKILKKKNKQNTLCHEAAFLVFYAYLFFLVFVTLTPNFIYSTDDVFVGIDKSTYENNIIPFSLFFNIIGFSSSIGELLKQFIPHLLIYIPIGLLSGLLWDRYKKFLPAVILGSCFAVIGEVCQYFSYRGANIDEAILHVLSFILGWLLLKLLLKFCPDYSYKFTYKKLSVHDKSSK